MQIAMDCPTLISQIKNKFVKTVKVVETPGSEEQSSPEYLAASSEFLRWFEEIISNATVENGETAMSAKSCILASIKDDSSQTENAELYEALALFSDKRIFELFGVRIFAEE